MTTLRRQQVSPAKVLFDTLANEGLDSWKSDVLQSRWGSQTVKIALGGCGNDMTANQNAGANRLILVVFPTLRFVTLMSVQEQRRH